MDEAALARVESQRLELQGQIAQLRKSLRHWQTLELDYEGLREEFSLLSEDCSAQEALEAAKDFEAELVDQQEIRTLFGFDKGARRSPAQVVDLLSKRVDYVCKNSSTIKKQLSDTEKKRNALLLAKEPDYREEAGLPLTEVTEELDDSGNVVSSKLETVQSAAPQLMEVLKKAGVDNLVEKDGIVTTASGPDGIAGLNTAMPLDSAVPNDNACQPSMEQPETETTEDLNDSPSFRNAIVQKSTSRADRSHVAERPLTERSKPDLDNDSILDSVDFPSNPDDTVEDAALRREMLEYAHGEIGPIVAQLELEDGVSDISYDEDNNQFFLDSEVDDEADGEDQSEDEYGQTKSPVISDKYRKKMENLEKKLGLKSMQNLGPEPDLPTDVTNKFNKPPAAEAARKAALERAEAAVKASGGNIRLDNVERRLSKQSKKVSFADNLDVAKEPEFQPSHDTMNDRSSKSVSIPPVRGSVVEQVPAASSADSPAPSTPQPKKVSRFKATRDATPQTPLLPPPQYPDSTSSSATKSDTSARSGDVMLAEIVERPGPPTSRQTPPPDPYDFDESLHKQEIAGEYYRSRNKMIQRQGGFVRDGEDDNYGEFTAALSLVDEETGKVRKISRFKAARLQ